MRMRKIIAVVLSFALFSGMKSFSNTSIHALTEGAPISYREGAIISYD